MLTAGLTYRERLKHLREWDEELHPRDESGKFVSVEALVQQVEDAPAIPAGQNYVSRKEVTGIPSVKGDVKVPKTSAIRKALKGPTTEVAIADIRSGQGYLLRDKLVSMLKGDEEALRKEPIVIIRQRSGQLALLDGNHRVAALAMKGASSVQAVLVDEPVKKLSHREALAVLLEWDAWQLREWDPDEHPRDDTGKFASKEGGGGGVETKGKLAFHTNRSRYGFDEKAAKEVLGDRDPMDVAAQLLRSLPGEIDVDVVGGEEAGVAFGVIAKGTSGLECNRYLSVENGEVVAIHSIFKVPLDARGQGLAKEVLADQVAVYRELGVSKVTLDANLSMGGYAWAKFGFTADDPEDLAEQLEAELLANATKPWFLPMKELVDKHRSDPKLPWHIASTFSDKDHIGKDLMRKVSWKGTLDLKNSDSMKRFDKYVNK